MLNILNKEEELLVSKMVENKKLMSAVKKVLLYGLYYNGTLKEGEEAEPMKNFAITIADQTRSLTDKEVGEILRGKRYAIEMLEEGFGQLELFKVEKQKEEKDKSNKAR